MTAPLKVSFYREVIGPYGRPALIRLDVVEVRAARSRQAAMRAAAREFEKRYRLTHWKHLATECRVDDAPRLSSNDSLP